MTRFAARSSELWTGSSRTSECRHFSTPPSAVLRCRKEHIMDGNIVGLVAVIMIFGIPIAAMYTYYRVRKLRTEERLAAIARGVSVPMEPELSQAARTRRSGILLVSGALGYTIAFALIGRVEHDAWMAAAFGVIPFAIGLGCFLDSALVRRDLRA
jgi:Domain of unknown function (DUF6249)